MGRISELTNGGTAVLEGYKEAMTRAGEDHEGGGATMLHLTLFAPGADESSVDESINGELAIDGLVKCVSTEKGKGVDKGRALSDPESRAVFEGLQALERDARRRHLGIFEYGDVDDDEDD